MAPLLRFKGTYGDLTMRPYRYLFNHPDRQDHGHWARKGAVGGVGGSSTYEHSGMGQRLTVTHDKASGTYGVHHQRANGETISQHTGLSREEARGHLASHDIKATRLPGEAAAARGTAKGKSEAAGAARGAATRIERSVNGRAAGEGEGTHVVRGGVKASQAEGMNSLHEKAAAWQAEHHAPAELKGYTGGRYTKLAAFEPQGHNVDMTNYDPYAKLSAETVGLYRQLYGDHQLGAALAERRPADLLNLAREMGVPGVSAKTHITELVGRITYQATNGHYSYHFEPTKAPARAPKADGETPKAAKAPKETGAREGGRPGNRVAQLEPIGHVDTSHYDPYATPNPFFYRALYGDRQLASALSRHTVPVLRQVAREYHIDVTGAGSSRASIAARIAKHVQDTEPFDTTFARFGGKYADGHAPADAGAGQLTESRAPHPLRFSYRYGRLTRP